MSNQAVNDNQVITKAYLDQIHQEKERSRVDLGIDFYDEANDLVRNKQDNDLNDKKLINLSSVTVNRNPTLDNELSNKKDIDNDLDKITNVRFNQTLEKYLKVSVGNDIYNETKNNEIQLTDITTMRAGILGDFSSLLENYL